MDAFAPGAVLAGRYRIERLIGEGGMGRVVEARHETLGIKVAIKTLRPEYKSRPGAAERFLREARTAASIRSEHVGRVLDAAMEGDEPLLVMELIEGATLAALIAGPEPPSLSEACTWLLHTCVGLAQIHRAGIVHRDLKPSNLFLTSGPDGSPLVKIVDFGIAKALDAEVETLTGTAATLGSPYYMSPEQIRNAHAIDEKSDIWSLGVVAYELLSRALPFEAATMPGLLASVVADPPVPLEARRAGLPQGLTRLVMRCLDKDPAARPELDELGRGVAQCASEGGALLAQLERLCARRGVPPPRASLAGGESSTLMETVAPWASAARPRRQRAIARRATGIAGVLLGGAVVVAMAWQGRSAPPSDLAEATKPAPPGEPTLAPAATGVPVPQPPQPPVVPVSAVASATSAHAADRPTAAPVAVASRRKAPAARVPKEAAPTPPATVATATAPKRDWGGRE